MNADKFNELFSLGDSVRYYPVKGQSKYQDCKTRSPAWELGHGAAVVQITGQSGSVSVEHITKLTREMIIQDHLQTVTDTFTVLRQNELDVTNIYAAFEWLFDCRKDLLHALENIENDDRGIPPHAWDLIQDAIAAAGGRS